MQKHDYSTGRNFNQLPIFDLNTLDEEHEIRIKYDKRGNPTHIRKERHYQGCIHWLALMAALSLCGIALWSGGS